MRLGIVIETGDRRGGDPRGLAAATEAAGLDLAWLEGGGPDPAAAALTAAAFVAPATEVLRLVAGAPVGPHPLHIAEQLAVADNISNGRMLLALGGSAEQPALLGESAKLVLAALAARPFSHDGAAWRVPGAVAGNDGERLLNVTPNPAQLELPVWLQGPGAGAAARELALCHVSLEDGVAAAADWAETERVLGAAAARLRRPALRGLDCSPDGDFDADALAARLALEAASWGLDVVFLRLAGARDGDALVRATQRLGDRVRPHLQMDRVPAMVADHWRATLQ